MAAAQQYIHETVTGMFNDLGRSLGRSGRSGITVEVGQGSGPPIPRPLPSYEVEETRRTMECGTCRERFAVYGLALFCPSCGAMAPPQQFGTLVDLQRRRLEALASLEPDALRSLDEAGVLTANYESTIKDGFGALEAYLKNRFQTEAPDPSVAKPATIFQRLEETNRLYVNHLGVDLAALAGASVWRALRDAAAVRHVLVHNAGVVDEKFLQRMPHHPQHLGQRLVVTRQDADGFVGALTSFARAVF